MVTLFTATDKSEEGADLGLGIKSSVLFCISDVISFPSKEGGGIERGSIWLLKMGGTEAFVAGPAEGGHGGYRGTGDSRCQAGLWNW